MAWEDIIQLTSSRNVRMSGPAPHEPSYIIGKDLTQHRLERKKD